MTILGRSAFRHALCRAIPEVRRHDSNVRACLGYRNYPLLRPAVRAPPHPLALGALGEQPVPLPRAVPAGALAERLRSRREARRSPAERARAARTALPAPRSASDPRRRSQVLSPWVAGDTLGDWT